MRLWKVLNDDGTPCHGGSGKWYLPHGRHPGRWMPEINVIEPCASGYHLCRDGDLIQWLGPAIYEAEGRGKHEDYADKTVWQQARLLQRRENWNERTARLFACWCVRYTPLSDGRTTWDFLDDQRSRNAVEVAERYAHGKATQEEWAAARAAARAAVWAAARAAAWAAARDAAGDAARAAVWDAARDAVWDAARAAARAAAKDAAWAAQTRALLELLETGELP